MCNIDVKSKLTKIFKRDNDELGGEKAYEIWMWNMILNTNEESKSKKVCKELQKEWTYNKMKPTTELHIKRQNYEIDDQKKDTCLVERMYN